MTDKMDRKEEVREAIRARILAGGADCVCDEPMYLHTTFRVGGPAKFFVTVHNEAQLALVTACARREKLPLFLLGNGSNLLVSDAGYDGIIVTLGKEYEDITLEGNVLSVGAAVPLTRLSRFATEHFLTGLEYASGIPGTLGGAVVMNAGAYGGEISQSVTKVLLWLPEEGLREFSNEEMQFSYRHSILSEKNAIVSRVWLCLQSGEKRDIIDKVAELSRLRREKQPLEFPSAGSTFKRPEGAFAGKLIMEAGLAGYGIGGAAVSEKHCGFIVNKGGATAREVYSLIREVIRKVRESSGYELETEVICLGDFDLG